MTIFRCEGFVNSIVKTDFGGDKSRLFAIYNSRGDEHLLIATSEDKARILARHCFDMVRTHSFLSKEVPKDYLVRKHLIPISERLQELFKNGAQGKVRVEYSGSPVPSASAYFFAYGWSKEVKL